MSYTKTVDWFELWFEDSVSIIDTMVKNMASDLNCGYDYFGKCISNQRQMINDRKQKFDDQMDTFKEMDIDKVNRWCYFDLKKRGVIT